MITALILWFITSGSHINQLEDYSYNLAKVIPYLAVLIVAILGVNVVIVLIGGIILAGAIGIIDGSYTGSTLL